jgi:hypothetical protein
MLLRIGNRSCIKAKTLKVEIKGEFKDYRGRINPAK